MKTFYIIWRLSWTAIGFLAIYQIGGVWWDLLTAAALFNVTSNVFVKYELRP